MAGRELGLHRASVEALMELDKKDPRRRKIGRLADLATQTEPEHPLQPVAIEIPTVGEGLYNAVREALAGEGLTYVVEIKPLSIRQLAADETNVGRFSFINPGSISDVFPPQMEIAFDPRSPIIPHSNFKATDEQIEITRNEERRLKERLPQYLRDLVSMPYPNASTFVQADLDYHSQTRRFLFPEYWVGTDDKTTIPGFVTCVGHSDRSTYLGVSKWRRDQSSEFDFPARMVVLPHKL